MEAKLYLYLKSVIQTIKLTNILLLLSFISEYRKMYEFGPPRLIQLLALLFLSLFTFLSRSIRVINNGLAPPEIVHSPVNVKRGLND